MASEGEHRTRRNGCLPGVRALVFGSLRGLPDPGCDAVTNPDVAVAYLRRLLELPREGAGNLNMTHRGLFL